MASLAAARDQNITVDRRLVTGNRTAKAAYFFLVGSKTLTRPFYNDFGGFKARALERDDEETWDMIL